MYLKSEQSYISRQHCEVKKCHPAEGDQKATTVRPDTGPGGGWSSKFSQINDCCISARNCGIKCGLEIGTMNLCRSAIIEHQCSRTPTSRCPPSKNLGSCLLGLVSHHSPSASAERAWPSSTSDPWYKNQRMQYLIMSSSRHNSRKKASHNTQNVSS